MEFASSPTVLLTSPLFLLTFSFFIQAYSLLKYEATKTLLAAVLFLRCLVSTASPSRCLLRNISSPPCNAVHKGNAASLFQVANAEARGALGRKCAISCLPQNTWSWLHHSTRFSAPCAKKMSVLTFVGWTCNTQASLSSVTFCLAVYSAG